MNPATPTAPALRNVFPPKQVSAPAPKMVPPKKRWFGYVTSRGNLRIKVFVDKNDQGRQTTANWLIWADTYVWAKTEPFATQSKDEALLQARKLLTPKLGDFQKQKETQMKPVPKK